MDNVADYGRLGSKVRGMKNRTSDQPKSVRDNKVNSSKRAVANEKISTERRQRGSMWP